MKKKTKICTKCGKEAELSEFYKDKRGKLGRKSECKECRSKLNKLNKLSRQKYNKEYRDRNREKLIKVSLDFYYNNREEILIKAKKYRKENLESLAIKQKERHQKNKEERNKQNKIWRIKNREKITTQRTNRYKVDLNFKLKKVLRGRIWAVLRGLNKSKTTQDLLGCSIEELKQHLQSRFTKGMTWNNYGRGADTWQIDHIKACAKFDLSKPSEQQVCFHYTNLQPLWTIDNIKKSNK